MAPFPKIGWHTRFANRVFRTLGYADRSQVAADIRRLRPSLAPGHLRLLDTLKEHRILKENFSGDLDRVRPRDLYLRLSPERIDRAEHDLIPRVFHRPFDPRNMQLPESATGISELASVLSGLELSLENVPQNAPVLVSSIEMFNKAVSPDFTPNPQFKSDLRRLVNDLKLSAQSASGQQLEASDLMLRMCGHFELMLDDAVTLSAEQKAKMRQSLAQDLAALKEMVEHLRFELKDRDPSFMVKKGAGLSELMSVVFVGSMVYLARGANYSLIDGMFFWTAFGGLLHYAQGARNFMHIVRGGQKAKPLQFTTDPVPYHKLPLVVTKRFSNKGFPDGIGCHIQDLLIHAWCGNNYSYNLNDSNNSFYQSTFGAMRELWLIEKRAAIIESQMKDLPLHDRGKRVLSLMLSVPERSIPAQYSMLETAEETGIHLGRVCKLMTLVGERGADYAGHEAIVRIIEEHRNTHSELMALVNDKDKGLIYILDRLTLDTFLGKDIEAVIDKAQPYWTQELGISSQALDNLKIWIRQQREDKIRQILVETARKAGIDDNRAEIWADKFRSRVATETRWKRIAELGEKLRYKTMSNSEFNELVECISAEYGLDRREVTAFIDALRSSTLEKDARALNGEYKIPLELRGQLRDLAKLIVFKERTGSQELHEEGNTKKIYEELKKDDPNSPFVKMVESSALTANAGIIKKDDLKQLGGNRDYIWDSLVKDEIIIPKPDDASKADIKKSFFGSDQKSKLGFAVTVSEEAHIKNVLTNIWMSAKGNFPEKIFLILCEKGIAEGLARKLADSITTMAAKEYLDAGKWEETIQNRAGSWWEADYELYQGSLERIKEFTATEAKNLGLSEEMRERAVEVITAEMNLQRSMHEYTVNGYAHLIAQDIKGIEQVASLLHEHQDMKAVHTAVQGHKTELGRLNRELLKLTGGSKSIADKITDSARGLTEKGMGIKRSEKRYQDGNYLSFENMAEQIPDVILGEDTLHRTMRKNLYRFDDRRFQELEIDKANLLKESQESFVDFGTTTEIAMKDVLIKAYQIYDLKLAIGKLEEKPANSLKEINLTEEKKSMLTKAFEKEKEGIKAEIEHRSKKAEKDAAVLAQAILQAQKKYYYKTEEWVMAIDDTVNNRANKHFSDTHDAFYSQYLNNMKKALDPAMDELNLDKDARKAALEAVAKLIEDKKSNHAIRIFLEMAKSKPQMYWELKHIISQMVMEWGKKQQTLEKIEDIIRAESRPLELRDREQNEQVDLLLSRPNRERELNIQKAIARLDQQILADPENEKLLRDKRKLESQLSTFELIAEATVPPMADTVYQKLGSSPYRVGDLNMISFKKEHIDSKKTHTIIHNFLTQNSITENSSEAEVVATFNKLIEMPNFIDLITKNTPIQSNSTKADSQTIIKNKQELAKIYPLTLEKSLASIPDILEGMHKRESQSYGLQSDGAKRPLLKELGEIVKKVASAELKKVESGANQNVLWGTGLYFEHMAYDKYKGTKASQNDSGVRFYRGERLAVKLADVFESLKEEESYVQPLIEGEVHRDFCQKFDLDKDFNLDQRLRKQKQIYPRYIIEKIIQQVNAGSSSRAAVDQLITSWGLAPGTIPDEAVKALKRIASEITIRVFAAEVTGAVAAQYFEAQKQPAPQSGRAQSYYELAFDGPRNRSVEEIIARLNNKKLTRRQIRSLKREAAKLTHRLKIQDRRKLRYEKWLGRRVEKVSDALDKALEGVVDQAQRENITAYHQAKAKSLLQEYRIRLDHKSLFPEGLAWRLIPAMVQPMTFGDQIKQSLGKAVQKRRQEFILVGERSAEEIAAQKITMSRMPMYKLEKGTYQPYGQALLDAAREVDRGLRGVDKKALTKGKLIEKVSLHLQGLEKTGVPGITNWLDTSRFDRSIEAEAEVVRDLDTDNHVFISFQEDTNRHYELDKGKPIRSYSAMYSNQQFYADTHDSLTEAQNEQGTTYSLLMGRFFGSRGKQVVMGCQFVKIRKAFDETNYWTEIPTIMTRPEERLFDEYYPQVTGDQRKAELFRYRKWRVYSKWLAVAAPLALGTSIGFSAIVPAALVGLGAFALSGVLDGGLFGSRAWTAAGVGFLGTIGTLAIASGLSVAAWPIVLGLGGGALAGLGGLGLRWGAAKLFKAKKSPRGQKFLRGAATTLEAGAVLAAAYLDPVAGFASLAGLLHRDTLRYLPYFIPYDWRRNPLEKSDWLKNSFVGRWLLERQKLVRMYEEEQSYPQDKDVEDFAKSRSLQERGWHCDFAEKCPGPSKPVPKKGILDGQRERWDGGMEGESFSTIKAYFMMRQIMPDADWYRFINQAITPTTAFSRLVLNLNFWAFLFAGVTAFKFGATAAEVNLNLLMFTGTSFLNYGTFMMILRLARIKAGSTWGKVSRMLSVIDSQSSNRIGQAIPRIFFDQALPFVTTDPPPVRVAENMPPRWAQTIMPFGFNKPGSIQRSLLPHKLVEKSKIGKKLKYDAINSVYQGNKTRWAYTLAAVALAALSLPGLALLEVKVTAMFALYFWIIQPWMLSHRGLRMAKEGNPPYGTYANASKVKAKAPEREQMLADQKRARMNTKLLKRSKFKAKKGGK